MADLWFYTRGGKRMDPVSMAELRRLAAQGFLKPTDMVWREGMPDWIRASAAQGLFEDAPLDHYRYRDPSGLPAAPYGSARPAERPRHRSPAGPGSAGGYGPRSGGPSGSAARTPPPAGMRTGTKVLLIAGTVLLLGGLAAAAVLLTLSTTREHHPHGVKVGKKTEAPPPEEVPEIKKGLVDTIKVFVPAFEETRRGLVLKGKGKYEISVLGDGPRRPNLFLDDPRGKEVALLLEDAAQGITFEPAETGTYQLTLTNAWANDQEFSVAIHRHEAFPFTAADFNVILFNGVPQSQVHELERGVKYEIRATNPLGQKMDLNLNWEGLGPMDPPRNVACSLDKSTGFISWECTESGRYRIEVANLGGGEVNARIVLRGVDWARVK